MQRAALGALGGAARAPPCRWRSAAPPALRELRELRARTGQPVMRCREALQRAGGDLRQAEAWLEAESRRRGWARAAAPGAARAREGLVGVLSEGSAAVMVEVNCETDFVARTPDFQQLVEMAARGVLGHCQGASGTKLLLREDELAQVRAGDGGELLSDHLALAMGRLGERLSLRRAGWLRAPGGFVATYAHGWVPAGPAVAMGTYGALVACGGPGAGPPPAELRELGRRVAQHVVGMAPTALGTPGRAAGAGAQSGSARGGHGPHGLGDPRGRAGGGHGDAAAGAGDAAGAGRAPGALPARAGGAPGVGFPALPVRGGAPPGAPPGGLGPPGLRDTRDPPSAVPWGSESLARVWGRG